MNNCLILLTNYYPFHKGEEYLESEIKYLADKFEKIYIISTMVSSDMKQTRDVPSNVEVLPIGIKHSKLGKLKMLINQTRNINKQEDKKNMILSDSKGKLINKLYCYYFESRSMEIYDKAKWLLDKFDLKSYESITIYSYWLYVTARVAVQLKNEYFKDKKTYSISRAHRYDIYEYAAPLKYLPEREYLLKNLDNIYPCSMDGVDFLNKTYPKYSNKIDVRRLGTISPEIIGNTTNEKLYIVSCSVLRKVKRVDLLVDSLLKLEKKNIPYNWTHIGDGPEFEKIKNLATKKLNNKNFKFEGFLKNKDVLAWYKENPATVFINLSKSEGVPVSIMEALSMGIPVVATDVGGTREIVKNNNNGYLLKADCEIQDIVNCLIKVNDINEKDYTSLCKNALNIWNKRCNAIKLYKEFSEEISLNQ